MKSTAAITKRIAVVGSSGGGKANSGATEQIVDCILSSLKGFSGCSICVSQVQFITCSSGLDFATDDWTASLFVYERESNTVRCKYRGNLAEVNKIALETDKYISNLVRTGQVDAIIAISCDPGGLHHGKGANQLTFDAAIQASVPIVGTGGTSISYLATKAANVIGCSGGSVAATPQTRAVCFLSSLASLWNVSFHLPVSPRWPALSSVCGSILPILLANAVLKLTIETIIPMGNNGSSGWIFESWLDRVRSIVTEFLIPVSVGAMASVEAYPAGDVSLLAGACAGALAASSHGPFTFIAAYLAGVSTGYLLPKLLVLCASRSYLPTGATIVSVGGSSLVAGTAIAFISECLAYSGGILRAYDVLELLRSSTGHLRGPLQLLFGVVTGGVLGWASNWGSEHGYYHTVMLPLIALEMQSGSFAVLGAFDLVCLCLPCAGVCCAVWLRSVLYGAAVDEVAVIVERHRRLGWKGFYSNIMFGDFVEACYPFIVPGMSAAYCWPLRVAVQLSCLLAGAILGMSWGVDLTRFFQLSSDKETSFFCDSDGLFLSGHGWLREAVMGGPARRSGSGCLFRTFFYSSHITSESNH
eukprot:gene22310-30554_t